MRCKHTGYKKGRWKSKAEDVVYGEGTKYHGYYKGEYPKHKAFQPVLPELFEVYFKTGRKHDINKSYSTKQNYTAVTQQQIEAIGTNDNTGNDQPDNMWHL